MFKANKCLDGPLLWFLLPTLWLLLRVVINVNDDVFVYFNYAKNFARGNVFSYDSRGVPSEGFTSLAYLLLLVPFEMLGISMPFAALLINTIALILSGVIVVKFFSEIDFKEKHLAFLGGGLFLVFCIMNEDVLALVGWGFETVISVPIFMTFLMFILRMLKIETKKNYFKVVGVFFLLGLVRPENLFICSPFLISAFAISKQKKTFTLCLVSWGLVGLAFIGWKWWVFHDVFPTGFYRKIISSPKKPDPGVWIGPYLREYLRSYLTTFLFSVSSLAAGLSLNKEKQLNLRIKVISICSLLLAMGCLIIFINRVNPLVGVHFRYLILCTVSLYLVGTFGFFLLAKKWKTIYPVTLFFLVFVLTPFNLTKRTRTNPKGIYSDSVTSIDQHFYVRLARHLQISLKNPEEIKLVFGDAGAIPYYFDCQFIDINGLTEPALARAFKSSNRAQIVSKYIIDLKPDMVVLAYGNNDQDPILPHGPLTHPEEYRFFLKKLEEEQFLYVGSITSYYDLHFGVRKGSLRFNDLVESLRSYIQQGNGYVLNSDLVVPFTAGSVIFPRYSPS